MLGKQNSRLRARVYSKALISLAKEQQTIESWRSVFSGFRAAIPDEMWRNLDDPRLTCEAKLRWLEPLLDTTFPAFQAFLEQLLRVRSLYLIPFISDAFNEFADEIEGIVHVTVETVIPLTPTNQEQLINKLEQRYGKKIGLKTRLNPKLRGGMRLSSKYEVLDGSLQKRIMELRQKLLVERRLC